MIYTDVNRAGEKQERFPSTNESRYWGERCLNLYIYDPSQLIFIYLQIETIFTIIKAKWGRFKLVSDCLVFLRTSKCFFLFFSGLPNNKCEIIAFSHFSLRSRTLLILQIWSWIDIVDKLHNFRKYATNRNKNKGASMVDTVFDSLGKGGQHYGKTNRKMKVSSSSFTGMCWFSLLISFFYPFQTFSKLFWIFPFKCSLQFALWSTLLAEFDQRLTTWDPKHTEKNDFGKIKNSSTSSFIKLGHPSSHNFSWIVEWRMK